MSETGYAIETRNLTKQYGQYRGITEVNLQVEEGDIFGYLGPNGAGKSTSVRCLLGMVKQTAGEAYVLSKQVGKEQKAILSEIGYMPSEVMFYPSMKAGEVIAYAARMRNKDCKEEARYLCDALEVDTDKRIRELSLGNRKKISIVCAMQHNPRLLVFDEPTSGLDPLMQEVFFQLIKEQNRKGTTCFLSSHVLSEVKKYCRHVGIIREGKIVKTDSVENMLHTGIKNGKILWKSMDFGEIQRAKGILENLEGVHIKDNKEGECLFTYSGGIQRLLQALSLLPVWDFILEEPTLEDIFMNFYGKENL